jgi:hypothetical protein
VSLLQRVTERTPELINEASEGAKELIIAPNPNLISTANSIPPNLGLALFGIVAIMAVITIWQTIKLYRPTILRL